MKPYSERSSSRTLPLLLIVIAVSSLLAGTLKPTVGQVGDFLISASPSRLTIGTDGIGRYGIRVTSVSGFTGTIQLDIIDLEAAGARTSFTFQPSVLVLATDAEAYSVLTVTAVFEYSAYYYSAYASLATVQFKVRAAGGGIARSTALVADVLYGATTTIERTDVKINLQPDTIVTSGEISQMKSETIRITLSPKSTTSVGEVLFTTTPQIYELPSGLYVSFDPVSLDIRAGQTSAVTATVVMTPEFLEKSGTHRLVIGISGLVTGVLSSTYAYQDLFVTKTAILTIVVPPAFNVAVNPSIMDVFIGGADQKLQIVVTPISRGLSQPITLRVEGVPAGLVASFDRDTLVPKGKESLQANLLVNAPSTAQPGIYPIRIIATTMGSVRVASISLNVRPSGDYSLRLDQTTVMLSGRGESRSVTLTVVPEGDFRSTINFSVVNVPRGILATLSTMRATVQVGSPITVILTLTATEAVQPGTYDVAIVANTGFSQKTISITLLVRVGSVEIWPVVLIVVILIAVISAIIFVGIPRGRQVRVVPLRPVRY